MGVDGPFIETHPDPATARSDARQQLDPDTFANMALSLKTIAAAIGKKLL